MNAEVKAKWLAALRSGEYKQGTGGLVQNGCFCCLGVLCDLYAKQVGLDAWHDDSFYSDGVFISDEGDDLRDGNCDFPPNEVVQWAGLASENPNAGKKTLSVENDDGVSFAEIADLIEAHL